MKNYVCRNCGAKVRRLSAPLRCDDCGQQRIGLFKVDDSTPTTQAAAPPQSEQPLPSPAPLVAGRQPTDTDAPIAASETSPPSAGEVAWRQSFATSTPLRSQPAVQGRRIYVCHDRVLTALLKGDDHAELLWEYATEGAIPGPPIVGADGAVRVHSCDGKLHCVSPDGEPVHKPAPVGQPLGWASPYVDHHGACWLSAYRGGLVKVAPDGATSSRPFFRSRTKFDSTGVVHDGVLYIGGEDGFVHAIRLSTEFGERIWDPSQEQGLTHWFVNSAVRQWNDSILVADRNEHLHAFHLDGSLKWRRKMSGQMIGSPIVTSDASVVVGLSVAAGDKLRGVLAAVDAASGQPLWEHPASAAIESTPVEADGVVIAGDSDGVIHGVDQGRALWTCRAGAAVRSTGAISEGGRALFGLEDGALLAVAAS